MVLASHLPELLYTGTGGFIETPNQRLSIRHQLPNATVGTFAKCR